MWGLIGGFMLWVCVYMTAHALKRLGLLQEQLCTQDAHKRCRRLNHAVISPEPCPGIAVSGSISISTAMCTMWFWDAVVFRTHSSAYALVLVCVVLQV